MRKVSCLLILLLAVLSVAAQTTKEEIFQNIYLAGGTYVPYWGGNGKLTPPPVGYEPFYMSHYGRHGSRFLMNDMYFNKTVPFMEKAAKEGKLTELGKQTLECIRKVMAYSKDKIGELSELGQQQHKDIATRMYRNFPQIFKDGSVIDARATDEHRAQESMEVACKQLQELNPHLVIHQSHNAEDLAFLRPREDTLPETPSEKVVDRRLNYVMDSLCSVPDIGAKMFVGKNTAKALGVKRQPFTMALFDITEDLQCLPELDVRFPEVFTKDELYTIWRGKNLQWTAWNGLHEGSHPHYKMMAGLVRNILDMADKAIAADKSGANLRYGHDKQLYPLAYLLGLDGVNQQIPAADYDQGQRYTANFRIVPMAANLQIIFYRKSGSSDILVKFLLNEQETHIPLATDRWPYYHWKDVRCFLQTRCVP